MASFQGGIQGALSILQLAPYILQLMLQVEQIFTAPKSGAIKKAVVMSVVPQEQQEAIGKLVDAAAANLPSATPAPAPAV